MDRYPRIAFSAVLQRKDPGLPVYIIVSRAMVAAWELQATTVVEGSVNGHAVGRRTIKRWDSSGESDWFVELTAPFCKKAGIAVGDVLAVSLSLAATEVPQELQALLARDDALTAAWQRLSQARRRSTMEYIRGGKSSTTRKRRATLIAKGMGGVPEE